MAYPFIMMGVMLGVPLLIVVIIIFVIIKVGQRNNQNYGQIESSDKAALEILNQRFAKGEITEEEYLHKKRLIQE